MVLGKHGNQRNSLETRGQDAAGKRPRLVRGSMIYKGSFRTSPNKSSVFFDTHYAKLASPSDDPALLDDQRLFIENVFQTWQVEGNDVLQPELHR